LAFFSGLSSGIGLRFLWILSFGKAKESISPKAKSLLGGATAEAKMMQTIKPSAGQGSHGSDSRLQGNGSRERASYPQDKCLQLAHTCEPK